VLLALDISAQRGEGIKLLVESCGQVGNGEQRTLSGTLYYSLEWVMSHARLNRGLEFEKLDGHGDIVVLLLLSTR